MKKVCVIGAGPGGLVAAKTLLETGGFQVDVFERENHVGGIWGFDQNAPFNRYLRADTPTNLSRFLVTFSDLSWESVLPDPIPMFPRAKQVGTYLEEYARRYIPSSAIHLEHTVVDVKYGSETIDSENNVSETKSAQWHVSVKSATGDITTHGFDFVVNAAGFFPSPRHSSLQAPPSSSTKVVHSSNYKSLADIVAPGKDKSLAHTNIVVLGGANSGSEAAATIASQLSNSQYSPTENDALNHDNVKIVHVLPHAPYVIPPYVPSGVGVFAPLDLPFYDLKWRPADQPIQSQSGPLDPSAIAMRLQAMQGLVGSQLDLSAEALVPSPEKLANWAPFAALGEQYPEFVRSGVIVPVLARFDGITPDDSEPWCTVMTRGIEGPTSNVHSVSAIIDATGYSPHASLKILPDQVLQRLEYDSKSSRLPIILQYWQTLNLAVPTLGFIGFYESAYWGVMEMQARVLAHLWSQGPGADGSLTATLPLAADESLTQLHALRQAIHQGRGDVPQYWFADYVGYLEELQRHLGLERNDAPFAHAREGPVHSARYLSPHISTKARHEAQRIVQSLHATVAASQTGRYRARAVFRALHGPWESDISNKGDADTGSGKTAQAIFHPRNATAPGYDGEYLYVEYAGDHQAHGKNGIDGENRLNGANGHVNGQTTSQGPSVQRVYRYNQARDELSVWSAIADSTARARADALLYKLEFAPVTGEEIVGDTDSPDAGLTHLQAQTKAVMGSATTDQQSTSQNIDSSSSGVSFDFYLRAIAMRRFDVRKTARASNEVTTWRYRRSFWK